MYQLNPALRNFWQTQKPVKILRGGRSSSKTHDAAGMAVFLARNFSLRFMCIRKFQNRITDSVYTVIKDKIEAAGWQDEFDITNTSIVHKETGSNFIFYGIARNLKEIKGTEGVDICWIEEGEGLTAEEWRVISPTIRKDHSEIWILYNPNLITDFVESKLPGILGDDCIIRTINYDENPFLSDKQKHTIARLKEHDYDEYTHVYRGVPRSNDDRAIIKIAWVEAAIDAHIKLNLDLTGAKITGYDVADDGEDMNATITVDGAIATTADEWKATEDELKQSALRAWSQAKPGQLIYDSIGVGAHVGSTLADVPAAKNKYYKFNAGESVVNPKHKYGATDVTNKEKFENLKAQAWQTVADRFRNTYNAVTKNMQFEPHELISISSTIAHLDELKRELSTPLKSVSGRGLDMVESKRDLTKRGIKSPNLADAFIMANSIALVKPAKRALTAKRIF